MNCVHLKQIKLNLGETNSKQKSNQFDTNDALQKKMKLI